MNILAFDTSDLVLSAALSSKTGIWYTEIDAGIKHSELLMECINGLCTSSGIEPKELNLIACMSGPGSFTGLRIGFSAAKGLAMALGIPMIPVPTLDCLAYSLSFWPGIVIPSIDAKKGCFFTALYRGKERLTGYMDAPPQTITAELEKRLLSREEPVVLTGSGSDLLYPFLAASFPNASIDTLARNGRARELIELAKNARIAGDYIPDSGPLYIRKSDAELKHG